MKLSNSRGFLINYDNPRKKNYRRMRSALCSIGDVQIVRHPRTTFLLVPRFGLPFQDIKATVASVVDPSSGSAMIFSKRTGAAYILSNRSNRRGIFRRAL
jgi:hypothetical protein